MQHEATSRASSVLWLLIRFFIVRLLSCMLLINLGDVDSYQGNAQHLGEQVVMKTVITREMWVDVFFTWKRRREGAKLEQRKSKLYIFFFE